MLEFARQAFLQHRYAVQQVWWDVPDDGDLDPFAWVADRLAEAVGAESAPPPRVAVVAKSLGTHAAPYVADRGWPAIWLTPLLDEPRLAAAIAANPARQLVVAGGDDPFHDARVAAGLGCDVLEIPGADHVLWVEGDAVRGAEIQLEVARATESFLAGWG